MKRNNIIYLYILFVVLIFILSCKWIDYPVLFKFSGQPTCKDCNVILISLDTLSANHLPCYGYERNTAPNLCKFGTDNILFKNMFSNANYTLPSHVSIFTGLYPNQHMIIGTFKGGNNYLTSAFPFLPDILQKNGYKTYFYMENSTNLPKDLVYYRGINSIISATHPKNNWMGGLKQLENNNSQGKKTFLFLHTFWVHAPYILENKDRKLYASKDKDLKLPETYDQIETCTPSFITYLKKSLKIDLRDDIYSTDSKLLKKYIDLNGELQKIVTENEAMNFCKVIINGNRFSLIQIYFKAYYDSLINVNDPEVMDHMQNLYDSKIVELDEYMQKVFDFILKSDLRKNTIIIVTSDHGEEFMEHGEWGHGNNLYDTTLKIPLMMYIPGLKNRNSMDDVQSIDIMPTILDLLNIKRSFKMSGHNLLYTNLLKDFKYTIAQENNGNSVIRDDEWKLFYRFKDYRPIGIKLFNYKKDRYEKENVIFKHNDVIERLLKEVQ